MDNQTENNFVAKDLEKCFIITPIGEAGSLTNRNAKGLINSVIKPVLKEYGFDATASDEINDLGSINNQIIKRILEDKLVIANLTDLNPNVMYELAIRHAARLPVIIMAETGTKLPFDITDQRTIFYENSMSGSYEAIPKLHNMVKKAIDDQTPDNPIYNVLERGKIFATLSDEDPMKFLAEQIEKLSVQVNSLNLSTPSPIQFSPTVINNAAIRVEFDSDLGKIDLQLPQVQQVISYMESLLVIKLKQYFIADNLLHFHFILHDGSFLRRIRAQIMTMQSTVGTTNYFTEN